MKSCRLNAIAEAALTVYPRRAPDITRALKRIPDAELVSLQIAHIDALDRIARGTDFSQHLWDWVSNVVLWSRVADVLDLGQDEMAKQLQLCREVLARWQRTGRIGFDGPGYLLAKHGVDVMDELARQVDQGTAHDAAVWTDRRLAAMRAGHEEKLASADA